MSQQDGVATEIAQAVVPEAMNQTAPASLNETDEAVKAILAKKEAEFNQLRSIKDKEKAEVDRARQDAENRAHALEAELAAKDAEIARATDQHWQTFQKYAPKEDVEQALTAYQQDAEQRRQREVQRAQWEAWKWRTLASEGVPAAEIEAAKSKSAVDALLQKYREEKLVAAKETEIEERIMAKLKKEGVLAPAAPAPKTPVDVAAAPSAKKKVTLDDVEKAREAFALKPSKATREAYQKATEELAAARA